MSVFSALANTVANYSDNKSMGSKLRRKRLELFIPLIDTAFEKNGAVNILDVGGTNMYWNNIDSSILDEKNVHITLVNLPGMMQQADEKHFTYIEADACDLSMIEDKAYHIAHSNSVVEHVGDWSRMVQFANEINRVSESHFVQTPNYWFPVEPHCMTPFFHWLPKPMRIWLVLNFNLGNWRKADSTSMAVNFVESARLLNRRMFKELFKDADIKTERIAGLAKSHIAIKSQKKAVN